MTYESLLEPISPEQPEGGDLSEDDVVVIIPAQRRAAYQQLELANHRLAAVSTWNSVRALATRALQERSKDMRVAVWWAEASLHIDGFAGAAEGIRLIRGLLEKFDGSLHPKDQDDAQDYRSVLAYWTFGSLPKLLLQLAVAEDNDQFFSFTSVLNAKRDPALAARIVDLMGTMPGDWHVDLVRDFQSFREELHQLKELIRWWDVDDAPADGLSEVLTHIRKVLELWRAMPVEPGTMTPSTAESDALPESSGILQGPSYDMFLQIETIPGDSVDPTYPKWIEVQSYTHELGATRTLSSVDSDFGCAGNESFEIVKFLDRASPKLYQAYYLQNCFESLALEAVKNWGALRHRFLRIELEQARIRSIVTIAAPRESGSPPTEKLTFAYRKIRWIYSTLSPEGGLMGSVSCSWALETLSE